MHPLQTLKQNRLEGLREIDQGSIRFIEEQTVETMVATTDISYARNQFGDMHVGEIFKHNLQIALRQSEKTRHGNIAKYNFLDLLYAFGRCEVLNDMPGDGVQLVVIRDDVPTVVQYKSGPRWGNKPQRQQCKEDATAWLNTYYPPNVGEIVICSQNGDSNSWGREPTTFQGRVVRELYGAACNEFFTGHAYPTELIDRQVAIAIDDERDQCPHYRNLAMIERKTMELQAELIKSDGFLHGFKLIDADHCPIWQNWYQAKERISNKKSIRKPAAVAA